MNIAHRIVFTLLTVIGTSALALAQNVGIGVTVPSHKLTILASPDSNALRLLGPGSYGSEARLSFGDIDVDRVFIEEDIDDRLTLFGLNRIALMGNNSFNVGIGTKTPEGELHISRSLGNTVLIVEADTDNDNELDNPQIEFRQDGNTTKAWLGFDETKLGSNVFGISALNKDGAFRMGLNGQAGFNAYNANVTLTVSSQPADDFGIVVGDSLGSLYFSVKSNKRVGIGVVHPDKDLHVYSGSDPTILLQSDGLSEPSGRVSLRQSNFTGYDMFYDGAADELVFEGFTGGTTNGKHMIIDLNGNMGIGTTDLAAGYKVSVKGKVAAEEILVDLSGSWPDYVFQEDYDLRSLKTVEAHIAANGHLPGMPSAQEMEAQGVVLGEMSRLLVEKVEELTLYILKQQKQLDEQKALIQQLLENSSK